MMLHTSVVRSAPLLHSRGAMACSARLGSPCCSVLDELKYQLSNSDEESRPARDLIENPIAFAYLIVLFALAAGLAYLALEDRRIAARQAQSLSEQMDAAEMLRAQGLDTEAMVLERDAKAQRKAAKPAPEKPKGLANTDPYGDDDEGNRFQRRQGRAARSNRRKGSRKKR